MSSLIDMMEQLKSLKNGVGIQSLLEESYKIMGNPFIMIDLEYNLLSYTETITDDPLWNELITYGAFSRESQELFKNEGFLEDYANAKRITFMISDKLKYDRILGKIFNKNNIPVARIVNIACRKPFEPHDPLVFENICKLITKEISRSDVYQTYEKMFQETFIKKLIESNIDDKELYAAEVSVIYNNMKENLYLAVVDISQNDHDYTNLVYFRDLFEQVHAGYKYAIYSNYILIIISTDNRTPNTDSGLTKLNTLFKHNNLHAGISSRFENLFELQKYYCEAQKALSYIVDTKGNQRIFPYHIESIHTMKQIEALEQGMGVQYLLNEACKIFGNPFLLQDMEFKLLAYTENVKTDDPIWEEFVPFGFISDETIAFFQNEGFVDAVVNTDTCTLLVSEKLKYDRLAGKIKGKDNIMIGYLIVVACHKQFSSDEIALFNAFCEKLCKEVSVSDFYSNYGQTYSESLINKLINGNINDSTLFFDIIANMYNDLKDNLYLAVVDIGQYDSKYTKLIYFRDLCQQIQAGYRYAIYSNYIVIIIRSDTRTFNVDKELHELNKLFEKYYLYAGISSCFNNIYELQKHYAEAVYVLNTGLKNKSKYDKQWIFQHDKID